MRKWRNRYRIWWEETKGEEKSAPQKMLLLLSVVILGFCVAWQGPEVLETRGVPKIESDQNPLVQLESDAGENIASNPAATLSGTVSSTSATASSGRLVLTFDCEGKGTHVEEILGILKEREVPAVFFVTGKWLDDNPEEAKMIADAGYEIGGHGMEHVDLSDADYKTCQEEFENMLQKINSIIGEDSQSQLPNAMRLYRPAYNAYNESLLKCADDSGITIVLYTLDTQDWKNYGAQELLEGVCQSKNLQDGAILWLHLNGKYTAQALEPMIIKLEKMGYQFCNIP